MARRGIYVEVGIDADPEAVWALTQDPRRHGRWDLRFSQIVPDGDTMPHSAQGWLLAHLCG